MGDDDIFLDWLKAIDRRMKAQGRRVLLFVDNALSHPKNFRLSNVNAVFLPANTSSLLLSLDQRIIAAIKKNNRKRLFKALVTRMNKGEDISNINDCVTVLDTCSWTNKAVREVTPSTVRDCFSKARITDGRIIDEDREDNVPLSELIQASFI